MNKVTRGGLPMLTVLGLAALLGGCAVGQKYKYDDASLPLAKVASSGTVGVGVQDARPYVVSGKKAETFVGLQRGGFGNPFDVNTASDKPLAADLRDVLAKAMKNKGLQVTPVDIKPTDSAGNAQQILVSTNARKLVLVTLKEWKSDVMMKASLTYDITLDVLNEKGEKLASKQTNGEEVIPGPAYATAPANFVRKLEVMFEDEKILTALK